tara:strand:- start:694 stop:921 length:228 start_codon:yes stop_codon:yes gene_type:complete
MNTGIKPKKAKKDLKEIQAMTILYKEVYDKLWNKMSKTSQDLIVEEPLGRRAKEFAHEVAKQAESKRYEQLGGEE